MWTVACQSPSRWTWERGLVRLRDFPVESRMSKYSSEGVEVGFGGEWVVDIFREVKEREGGEKGW